MREIILIKQPGKTGDIIKCLPIAFAYAAKGYEVYWECPKQYHHMFHHYIDYVHPTEKYNGPPPITIDMSFGLNTKSAVHKIWMSRRLELDSFVTLKYELAGVPVSECHNLNYKRNGSLEDYLFYYLGLDDCPNYVLIHNNSDYGTPISVVTQKHMVRFTPIRGFSIWDWRRVIENAEEIHCIDSSLANFVDAIKPTKPRLHYYITDRVPMQSDRTLLQMNWETIKLI